MHKSIIKVNSSDITLEDLKAMINSQHQLSALTEKVEAARLNKIELNGKSYSESFFLSSPQNNWLNQTLTRIQ